MRVFNRRNLKIVIAVVIAFLAGAFKSYIDESKQSEREREIIETLRSPGNRPSLAASKLQNELRQLRGDRWVDDVIFGCRAAAVALLTWILAEFVDKKRWVLYLGGFVAFAQLRDDWSRDLLTVVFGLLSTGWFGIIVVLLTVLTVDNFKEPNLLREEV